MCYVTISGFITSVIVLDGVQMAIPRTKDGIGLTSHFEDKFIIKIQRTLALSNDFNLDEICKLNFPKINLRINYNSHTIISIAIFVSIFSYLG